MDRFVKPRLDKELLGKERDLTAGQMMRLEAVLIIIIIIFIITMIIMIIINIMKIIIIIIMVIMKGCGSPAAGKVPVVPTKRRTCASRQ